MMAVTVFFVLVFVFVLVLFLFFLLLYEVFPNFALQNRASKAHIEHCSALSSYVPSSNVRHFIK